MKNMNIENRSTIKTCASIIIGITAIAGCASTEAKPVKQPITQAYEEPKNAINTYIAKDNNGDPIKVICNGFTTFEDIQKRMQYVGTDFDSAVKAMQVIDSGSNLPTVPEYIQITYAANGVTDASAIPELNTLRFPNNCEQNSK